MFFFIVKSRVQKKTWNKSKLREFICGYCNWCKKELFTKTRTTDIVRSRNIIHNILNEKYKMSLSDIGRIFGQDHTTVLHSIEMKLHKRRFWSDEQTIWQEFQELIS